jgi:hypothetical protein
VGIADLEPDKSVAQITPDEFLETHEFYRDTANKAGGTLTGIQRDAKGNPILDKRAWAAFQKNKVSAGYQDDVSKIDTYLNKEFGPSTAYKGRVVLYPTQVSRTIPSIQEQIFEDAHDEVVDTVNKDFAKPAPKSSPGPASRALANHSPQNSRGGTNSQSVVTLQHSFQLSQTPAAGMSQVAQRAPESAAQADNDFYTVGITQDDLDRAVEMMVNDPH